MPEGARCTPQFFPAHSSRFTSRSTACTLKNMNASVILADLRDHGFDFPSGFQVGESKVRGVRASLGETVPPEHRPEPVSTQ